MLWRVDKSEIKLDTKFKLVIPKERASECTVCSVCFQVFLYVIFLRPLTKINVYRRKFHVHET